MDNLTEAQLLELFEDKSNFDDLVDYFILHNPHCIDSKILFEDNDNESNYMTIKGIYYYYGIIVEEDIAFAIKLFQRAINLNNSMAMNCLAYCYKNGNGVQKDIDNAIKLFQKAIELNNSDAMFNLAICYEDGNGVDQDINHAIDLYQKAINLNNSDAMNNLGEYYFYDNHVEQHTYKAIELFKRAIDLNNSFAMTNLAICYKNSIGVKKDISKTIELLHRAVDLNNPHAMDYLACCYENEIGVEQNIEKSIDLYYKSGKNQKGDELCIQNFDIINKYNTEKQINAKLFEEYILLISKLDYEININDLQYLNEPVNTKEYFYDWLELKKMNKELEELNKRMNIEIDFFLVKMDIKYRPGGLGYEEAKKDFESLLKIENNI